MTHEQECPAGDREPLNLHCDCICAPIRKAMNRVRWQESELMAREVEAAYLEGYNDHARSQQHWQDTHGAYRQHGEGGYHSQRCLHCDHIRATHTLTSSGCIGHALPGRPGAACPCSEFLAHGKGENP